MEEPPLSFDRPPVRVAQIGVGGMGGAHVQAIQASPRAELVAACDLDPGALAPLAAAGLPIFDDLATMLEAVPADALVAVLPHDRYPDVVNVAARHELAILKEKPFARNLTDALEMRGIVQATGVPLLCAAQRVYTTPFRRAAELLADGAVGEVFLVQGTILYNWHTDSGDWGWRGQFARSGGIAIVDSGWHILDAVLRLLGVPAWVFCRIGAKRAAHGAYDVDDKAAMTLEWPDGAVGSVVASFVTATSRFELLLHGTEASLEIGSERLVVRPRDGGEPTVIEHDGSNPMVTQLEHFCDVVQHGVPPRVGVDEALQIQRVVEAAYESASVGHPVSLT